MTNCGKGKANTVHPECIGEQHYSDDHGTGSAIKMAKAPDVDLEKGDGQAAPDPTVENALEKAGETRGSPVKEGIRENPYPGKRAKYVGPKSLGEPVSTVDVAYKGDTRSPAPKKAHQNPAGASQHYIDPVTGKALNDTKTRHAPTVTMEEHNAPYKAQAAREEAQRQADDALYNEMARRYSGLGFKQWDGPTFKRTYENMVRNPEKYQAKNPAYYKAVMDIYNGVMDDDAKAKADAALKARADAHAEAMQRQKSRAISDANANPDEDTVYNEDAVYGIHDPKYKQLGDEAKAEYEAANPQTKQNSYKKQDRELKPTEVAGRKAKGVRDAPRTLIPEGSNMPVSRTLTHNWENPYKTDAFEQNPENYTGYHANAKNMRPPDYQAGPDGLGGYRQYVKDKPLTTKQSDNMENSARTDFPSFDELKKSSVKDLMGMWNDLMKSTDLDKSWADERSWSDDEAINDEIEEKIGAEHWSKENALRRRGVPDTDGGAYDKLDAQYYPQTDTNYVNLAVERAQRADRANAVARSLGLEPREDVVINGVIQKSFKEIMTEGSEKKIGTQGMPAGSDPYGYPLRGNGMPIMNGYRQVFISREDMVMPPIGQMKHTKN